MAILIKGATSGPEQKVHALDTLVGDDILPISASCIQLLQGLVHGVLAVCQLGVGAWPPLSG